MMQSVAMTSIARRAINAEGHIIICGYGRSGQNLARLLDAERIPYMALDLDPDRVRQAAAAGQSVVFGDAARLQSLMAAGLARARAVVVSYPDTPSALKILELARAHAPRVPVIVRTIDDADLEKLRAAGATEVVPEAIEGSLMLASHALALVGVPMRRVIRVVQEQRRRALWPAARLLPRRRRRHRRRGKHPAAAFGHAATGEPAARPWPGRAVPADTGRDGGVGSQSQRPRARAERRAAARRRRHTGAVRPARAAGSRRSQTARDAVSLPSARDGQAGAAPTLRYFPMQKLPNISPSKSSALNWPVISARQS